MRLLIDADSIVYRSACATETRCYNAIFSDGYISDLGHITKKMAHASMKSRGIPTDDYRLEKYIEYEPEGHAVALCKGQVNKIITSCGYSNISLYLTSNDKSNFRFNLVNTPGPAGFGYKEGRPSRPRHYSAARNSIIAMGAEIIKDIEADDKLGIEACKDPDGTIIVHQDKDINMIPGNHYDFVSDKFMKVHEPGILVLNKTGGKKPKKVLSGNGIKWFYAQMLLGDRCDNIPGIRGVGDVAAYKLLKDCKEEQEMIDKVLKVYYTKLSSDIEKRFLEVADLLWILRKPGKYKSDYLKEII